jgi:hypothetical protein
LTGVPSDGVKGLRGPLVAFDEVIVDDLLAGDAEEGLAEFT